MIKPTLIITVGLTGTGKTTLAQALAGRLGAVVISSDVTRKRLAGISKVDDHEETLVIQEEGNSLVLEKGFVIRKQVVGILETEHRFEEFNSGIYSPEFTDKTYETILSEANGVLASGNSVILDASFANKERRLRARELAKKVGADFLVIECVLDEDIARERLSNRRDTPSDGTWEVYQEQKKVFEPVVEMLPEEHVIIDMAKPIADNVGQILELLSKGGKVEKSRH